MATIKDIAKAAGVSQGTVSNVLNGKGNVSSAKIHQVKEVCALMGYALNEKAKLLRTGSTKTLAAILPNISSHHYAAFFAEFQSSAAKAGYRVNFYSTGDIASCEREALHKMKSSMDMGAVIISSFSDIGKEYLSQTDKLSPFLFVERAPSNNCGYLGFDYRKGGQAIAKLALQDGCRNLIMISGNVDFSNESDFCNGVLSSLDEYQKESPAKIYCRHVRTNFFRQEKDAMDLFETNNPDALLLSNYCFAETVKDIRNSFYPNNKAKIYTMSPLFNIPERDFIKYELDYRHLGKVAAESLLRQIETGKTAREQLENVGYRVWSPPVTNKKKKTINVLGMNSPATEAIRYLSHLFTEATGIEMNLVTFNYNELFDLLSGSGDCSVYDIIRLDTEWTPWVSERLLMPIDKIEPDIRSMFCDFLPGLLEQYSTHNGHVYAIPSTPSVQFLFYRKDLFDDSAQKRIYFETFKKELLPPQNFEEFNQIAAFFTQEFNPASPVKHGSVLTLGSTSMAAFEFLTRYFSIAETLKTFDGTLHLDSSAAVKALQNLVDLKPYVVDNVDYSWSDTARRFANDDVAMAILFNNNASYLLDYDSKVNGKIGYAMVPGKSPMFSGGVFGISKDCPDPQEALQFIRWSCSETVATAMTMLGGVSPCRKTYQNHEAINLYPWLEMTQACFESQYSTRLPSRIAPIGDERNFMGILGMAVKSAYQGTVSAQTALAYAQKKLYPKL